MSPACGAEWGCKHLVGQAPGGAADSQGPRPGEGVTRHDACPPTRSAHSAPTPTLRGGRQADHAAQAEPPFPLPVSSPTPIPVPAPRVSCSTSCRESCLRRESKPEVSVWEMSSVKGSGSALGYKQAQPQDARGPEGASSSAVTSRPAPLVYFMLTHKAFELKLTVYFMCNHLCVLCDQPADLPEQSTDDNSAFPVIAEAVSLRAVNSGVRGKSLVLKGPALPPTPWVLTGD